MAFSLSPGAIAAAGDMWDGQPSARRTFADQTLTGLTFSTGASGLSFTQGGVTTIRAVVWLKTFSQGPVTATVGSISTLWQIIASPNLTTLSEGRTIATGVGPRGAHCLVLQGVMPNNDQGIHSANIQLDFSAALDSGTFDINVEAT